MDQERAAHSVLVEYVGSALGRRTAAFGDALVPELFEKIVLGVTDQLSGYMQCCPSARLRLGTATLRQGAVRSYVLIPVSDRGAPLRLQEATQRWDMIATDSASTLVFEVNGRRWAFIDKYFHALLEPALTRIADAVITYYYRRPHAQPTAGLIRFMEDVHKTLLVTEIDDRSETELGKADTVGRYYLQ
jgi:hypothetical protein